MRQCLRPNTKGRLLAVGAALAILAGLRGDGSHPPTGRGLFLSDVHFDPLAADAPTVGRLIASPIEAWDAILEPTLKDGFSQSPNDADYPLMTSALANAEAQEPYDLVVFTGDTLRHNFKQEFPGADFPSFACKTAAYVTRKIQRRFAAPVIFAVGNNDSVEGDYIMSKDEPVFAAIADELTIFDKAPEAKARFRYGGYCALPHPTVPKRDVIVLNSVLWSQNYKGTDTDLGTEEMKWLAKELDNAKKRGRRVSLVMHVPPGADAYKSAKAKGYVSLWQPAYTEGFVALMKRHKGTVQALYAGHSHMDDFKVMSDGGTPFLPMRTSPSVSPSNGNNPAFSTFDYDLRTAEVRDVATFSTTVPPAAPTLPWTLEYRFTAAYAGYLPFSPDRLAALAQAVRGGGPARASWEKYNAVSAPNDVAADVAYYACAQTTFLKDEYDACVGAFP